MSMQGAGECGICGAFSDYCTLYTARGITVDCRDLQLREGVMTSMLTVEASEDKDAITPSDVSRYCVDCERLTAEIERLDAVWKRDGDVILTLRAERDAMQEAMTEIASNHGNCDCNAAWCAMQFVSQQDATNSTHKLETTTQREATNE